MPKKRYTEQEIKTVVTNWKASNKNINQFARENGYSQASLGRWIKKLEKTVSKNSFVELSPLKAIRSSEKQTIVIEKADIKITVPLNIVAESLQNIMNVLVSCK